MLSSATGPSVLIIGGRYQVIRALATGGMGNVYEAENTRTLRRVAIKTIRPEVAQRASVVHRFEREDIVRSGLVREIIDRYEPEEM